jgi:hypothetical protein
MCGVAMKLHYVLGNPISKRNGGAHVRLAEDLRRCVVYLGIRPQPGSENRIESAGTGFFVSLDEPGGTYLVTASHIAKTLGESFVVRFNDRNGDGQNEQLDDPVWEFHSDQAVDLAALPFQPPSWSDCLPITRRQFLTEDYMARRDIGAGDLVHIVGAFRLLQGERRNLPLVHTGHVALLPEDEPIPVKGLGDVRGYLVQVQTLRGSSGSPVFVRRHVGGITDTGDPLVVGSMYGDAWLMGVNHGGWFGKPDDVLDLPGRGRGAIEVPVSMAIVIPSERLIEVLDSPRLKTLRAQAAADERSGRSASLTAAFPAEWEPSTKPDNPQHKEDFNRLLDEAMRKPKQGDQT